MAIVIPSKNIYEIKNPKVRDNVIERIEVGEVKVVPDNKYDTAVYNEKNTGGFTEGDILPKEEKTGYFGMDYKTFFYAFYNITPIYKREFLIKIPRLKDNHYIKKITEEKDEDGNIAPKIRFSFSGLQYNGTIETSIENIISEDNYTIVYKTPIYSNPEWIRYSDVIPKLEYTFKRTQESITAKSEFKIEQEISITEGEDIYFLHITVFSGYEEIMGGGYYEYDKQSDGSYKQSWEEHKSSCVKIIPEELEVTVYGNTIGIDLKDNTIYINGTESKKVFSIEGNELMQASNYADVEKKENIKLSIKEALGSAGEYEYGMLVDPGVLLDIGEYIYYNNEIGVIKSYGDVGYEVIITVPYGGSFHNSVGKTVDAYFMKKQVETNAIENFFSSTQQQYSNGKETATIRCSVGEYDNNFSNVSTWLWSPYISSQAGVFTIPYKITEFHIEQRKADEGSNIAGSDLAVVKINSVGKYSATFTKPSSMERLSLHFYETPNATDVRPVVIYSTDGLLQNGETYTVTFEVTKYTETEMQFKNVMILGKAISTETSNKMCFDIHDEVIPMVYGANGIDRPMSLKKDGTPKVFKVLGTKMVYDGAVWQELSLQEA